MRQYGWWRGESDSLVRQQLSKGDSKSRAGVNLGGVL